MITDHERINDAEPSRVALVAAINAADGLRAAADFIEEQAERVQHDALVILGMEAELAEAHAEILRLTRQRDALLGDLRYALAWMDNDTIAEFCRDPDGKRIATAARDAVKDDR